ncbi:TIGR04255 family protein [Pseudomonas sp. GD04058]|uniref:TIGR04255 family protein n=1 Tax=Pseudomonas sp. GD04058 TaxID=2975429 RepID=UPI0024499519|nr:TIGR04255 family protein [Pseudomonas sp. GD04058]MDG9884087.1 TIGR04255 family protein [Pseudomonas sp. GD04058]
MLKPKYEAHSIASISLTCEYDGEVDAHGLTALKDEMSRLKVKYKTRRVARKSNTGDSTSSAEVRGYMFLNKDGDEEINRFEIISDSSTVTSRSYTSFLSFFAEAAFGLEIAHNSFLKSERKLEKIVLGYKDLFTSDEINDIVLGVNPDSQHLPPACIKKANFWHSNVGFFDEDLAEEDQILHNVRVNHSLVRVNGEDLESIDDEAQHALILETYHILSTHQDSHQPFKEQLENAAYRLRARHKEILNDILAPELANRIGLNKFVAEG